VILGINVFEGVGLGVGLGVEGLFFCCIVYVGVY
jgi:hypothetical protein